jgi:peptidoglycan hydrolase-like protein with peptidoglycan-binding domain
MAERRRGGVVAVLAVAALAVVAVAAVAVAVRQVRASPSNEATASSAAAASGGLALVQVQRTDVADRQQVSGTLGYAGSLTAVSHVAGTVTAAAAPGRLLRAGAVLATVDATPVVLMLGPMPAWRSLAIGSADGADVRELEQNLRVLGYDPGHAMTVDDHFSSATAAAVRRWQSALGVPHTGRVTLGAVVFLPSELRVTADVVTVGGPVGPGEPLVVGTTTQREVAIALDAGRQGLVHVGDTVAVTLPDGTTTTRGVVSFVARVASSGGGGGSAGVGGGGGGGGGGAPPTVQVTVRLLDQAAAGSLDQAPVQVAITDQLHAHVLAVPVTALVAVPGGYALTRPDGSDVPVRVGLFDDLTQLVEVSGDGVTAGMQVQVPRP